jgi:photosystem II stability/assembly factor-like uncharacterized protein
MKRLFTLSIIVFVLTTNLLFSQTWVQTLNGIPMWSMCRDVQGNVYAGTSGTVKAVYKTTNTGQNWITLIPGSTANFLSLATDSTGNIFAANVANGLMKSTDGGNNWTTIPTSTFGNKSVESVACGKNGYVYAGCISGGVFRSTDYGVTFPDTSLTGATIVTLVVDKYNPNIIYAGASSTSGANGFYLSTNAGLSFTGYYTTYSCWGVLQKTPTELYMITTSTGTPFSKSTDGGYNWSTVSTQPGAMRGSVLDIAGNIYICGNGGVFKSTNNGVSFTNTGITTSGNQIVNVGTRMYAAMTGASTGGVWIYNDTSLTGINPVGNVAPRNYELKQNYPNPFNPSTNIEFSIPDDDFVSVKVFDIMGREIKTLVNERLKAGKYSLMFNGTGLSSGVYFYKFYSGKTSIQKSMVLIK